jgi:hypothetical protein
VLYVARLSNPGKRFCSSRITLPGVSENDKRGISIACTIIPFPQLACLLEIIRGVGYRVLVGSGRIEGDVRIIQCICDLNSLMR